MKNGNGKRSSSHVDIGLGSNRPPGTYHYGEGFSPISDEINQRLFTDGLAAVDCWILVGLNREAWAARKLLVSASSGFLSEKTGIPDRTIERRLAPTGEICARGFLRIEGGGYASRKTNLWFVEPVFIWSGRWDELQHFERSRLFTVATGLRDVYEAIWREAKERRVAWTTAKMAVLNATAKMTVIPPATAKLAVLYRQTGGTAESDPATNNRQNGGEIHSDLSEGDGAQRHTAPNKTESGVVPPQLPPDPPLKGVGLSPDAIPDLDERHLEAYKAWTGQGKPGKLLDFIATFLARAAETPLPGLEDGADEGGAARPTSAPPLPSKARLAIVKDWLNGLMTETEYFKRLAALDEAEGRESLVLPKPSKKRRPRKKVGTRGCAIHAP